MKLYYNFHDLWSFEYEINEEDVIWAIYKKYNEVYDIRLAETLFMLYPRDIYNYFYKKAYIQWTLSEEYRRGVIKPYKIKYELD